MQAQFVFMYSVDIMIENEDFTACFGAADQACRFWAKMVEKFGEEEAVKRIAWLQGWNPVEIREVADRFMAANEGEKHVCGKQGF